MILGVYSGNLISSVANPSTYTAFSSVAGGYVNLPLASSDIDGKVLRFILDGYFTYGASSPELYIAFGDPSTFPTGEVIIDSYPYSQSSTGTYPFSIEGFGMYSSNLGKFYTFGKTLDSGGFVYRPNLNNSTSSQTLAPQTFYKVFPAVNFGANNVNNSITINKFEISTVH